ncbi:FIST signal transduction protein [Paractinoplanes durhamensis]|nr:FIST N-terminal domain-containing protein [Actinoplanes durhamensis]
MVVFPSVEYDPHVFFSAAADAAAPAQVVGCSSHAGFVSGNSGAMDAVAIYLPADDLSFGIAAVAPIGTAVFACAQEVTTRARERAGDQGDHAVLLVLSDGLAGDQREIVRGSYSVTGATVPLVGAAASDDLSMSGTYQFAEGEVMSNGLIAVWINAPYPLGIGVEHGWHPIGEPMVVTRAEGNVIHELDGRPAAEVYLFQRSTDPAPAQNYGSPERTFAADTFNHPLGLANASGRLDGRHILGRTDEGALIMFGHVSEQSVVQVMAGDADDLVRAAGRAAAQAAEQLDRPSRGALIFSCTGRIAPLGAQVAAETAAISAGLGDVPVAGFFTFGEFARVTGSTGFHNATVVVLAV